MSKKLHYIICTIILALGLMTLLHGSRLILQTYQRESVFDEALKIGAFPDDAKARIFAQRGLKDGIIHLLYQAAGLTVALASGLSLARRK